MKDFEGYICAAKFPTQQELLFGPTTGRSDFSHERFITNGMMPFISREDAELEAHNLAFRKRSLGFTSTHTLSLRIAVAETYDERKDFPERSRYIIIAELDKNYVKLLGKRIDMVPGVAYAPVSDFEGNGLRTIKSLHGMGRISGGAMFAFEEVARQGHIPVQLAICELHRTTSKKSFYPN